MEFDLSKVKQFYEHHLKRYGKEDIRGMGWFEEEDYSIRFEVALGDIDLNGKSILDVGCGFGGLYTYLQSSDVKNFDYLGVDILPKMVEIAKQKNPSGKFEVKDILKDDLSKFDYVFCIGALNISTKDFSEFFKNMVEKMISLSNEKVVLNFLSDPTFLVTGPYHFEDPKHIKKLFSKNTVDVKSDERILGESFVYIS